MERNFITNKDVGLQPIHLCSVGLSNGNGALTNMQVTNWYQPPFFQWGQAPRINKTWGPKAKFSGNFHGNVSFEIIGCNGVLRFWHTIFFGHSILVHNASEPSVNNIKYVSYWLVSPCNNQAPMTGQSPVCK